MRQIRTATRGGARSWLVIAALAGAAGALVTAPAPAAAQGADDEESQLLVEEAKRALARRDYPRAGKLLDQALRVTPRRIDLYVLRASIHGVRGEHAAAVALLQRAKALAPDNPSVTTALGIQLVQADRAGEGVPLLEKIVAADARRYDAQVVLGHHYVATGAWDQAVAAFAAYFEHRPKALAGEDTIHRADQATATLRSGDARGALALFRQVLAADRTDELARLGVAWSTAAIDCRQAMPVFDGIADLEEKYAQVALVRGRCALLLGRLDEALSRAERYRRAMPESVLGWTLLGDVRTAQRNWKEAEAAFTRALEADQADKVVAFKLGRTERLLGKHHQAAERLRASGPPRDFEDDWTLEYGEALLALDDAAGLRDHLAPWVKGHAGNPTGQFLYGAALHRLGDDAAAIAHLDRAHAGGEPRAGRALIAALNTLAAAAVKRKDLGEAAKLLGQAEAAGDDVLTWRNLGAVLIAQGDADRAATVLRKAVDRDKDDPVAAHLLARALHAGKKWDDARMAYQRAVKAYGKDPRAAVAQRDLANAELAAGHGEEAVAALDAAYDAAPAVAKAELAAVRLQAARAAATDAMRGGRFAVAVRVLKQVEKAADGDALTALRCDSALAATGSGQRDLALDHLRKLERAKVKCPFVAPADELGVPILIAWNEGASLRKATDALARLDGMRRRVTGVAEPLVRQAARDIALRAAVEAYGAGNVKQAAKFLVTARNHDRRSPELLHNLAVVELAGGDADDAIRILEQVVGEVPEARVNLGIAWDRKGEPQKALDSWRAAVASGVRYGPLRDWIEAKERFWGTP